MCRLQVVFVRLDDFQSVEVVVAEIIQCRWPAGALEQKSKQGRGEMCEGQDERRQ